MGIIMTCNDFTHGCLMVVLFDNILYDAYLIHACLWCTSFDCFNSILPLSILSLQCVALSRRIVTDYLATSIRYDAYVTWYIWLPLILIVLYDMSLYFGCIQAKRYKMMWNVSCIMFLYDCIHRVTFLPDSKDAFYADAIIVDDAPRCDDPWNDALWNA